MNRAHIVGQTSSAIPESSTPSDGRFADTASLLDHVTRHWQERHVTLDLQTYEDIQPFVKRPWFMVVYVDAPLLVRFAREKDK